MGIPSARSSATRPDIAGRYRAMAAKARAEVKGPVERLRRRIVAGGGWFALREVAGAVSRGPPRELASSHDPDARLEAAAATRIGTLLHRLRLSATSWWLGPRSS